MTRGWDGQIGWEGGSADTRCGEAPVNWNVSAHDGTWVSHVGNPIDGLVDVGGSYADGSPRDLCDLGRSPPVAG